LGVGVIPSEKPAHDAQREQSDREQPRGYALKEYHFTLVCFTRVNLPN
jgi:hypothetical protein